MSFFADLLGNAALSGERVLGDHINHQQDLAKQTHADKLATERARAVAVMQQEMAEQASQDKMKRLSDQTQAVETKAADMGKSRRAQELLAAGAGDPSTISPEQAAVLKQAGRIKGDTPLSGIDDQISAARSSGFYELEGQLKASRDSMVKQMRDEWKQSLDERKVDQVDRRLTETEANNERRHREAMARAGSSGGGGDKANGLHSSYDNDQGYRVNVMRDGTHVVATDTKGQPITTEKFAKRVDAQVKFLKKEGSREERSMDTAKLRELVATQFRKAEAPGPAAPAAPAKPMAPDRASQFKVIR